VSLELTGPTAAQVLIQLAPMFLLFGGLIVFRERFVPLQWAGFAVLVTGLGVFFHDRIADVFAIETRLGLGVAVMLFSAVAWAGYALAQKQAAHPAGVEQVLFLLYLGAVPAAAAAGAPRAASHARRPAARHARLLLREHSDRLRLLRRSTRALGSEPGERRGDPGAGLHRARRPRAAWMWPGTAPAEALSGWNLLGAALVVGGSMTTALGARSRAAASTSRWIEAG